MANGFHGRIDRSVMLYIVGQLVLLISGCDFCLVDGLSDLLIAYTRPYTGSSYFKPFQLVSFLPPDLVQCSTSFRGPMFDS